MRGNPDDEKPQNQDNRFSAENSILKQMHIQRLKRLQKQVRQDRDSIDEHQLLKIHQKIEQSVAQQKQTQGSLEKQILLNMVIYDKRPTKPPFMINFLSLFQDQPVGKAPPYVSSNIQVVMITTFGFQLETFRFLIQSKVKCFIINDSDLKQTKIYQKYEGVQNFTVIERARKIVGYGVSHTKLWLIKFKKFLRVVISTSNQHIMDWTIWLNAYWYQDFPLKQQQPQQQKNQQKQQFDYNNQFQTTLKEVAENLVPNGIQLKQKIGIDLMNYQYRDVNVILIPSLQGRFQDERFHKLGLNKVGRVVRKIGRKFKKPIMTYVSTSLGTVDSKFIGQLFEKFCPGIVFNPKRFRLVYPTERYINQQTCQQAQILFLTRENYEKCDIKSQIFHKFDTNPRNPILGCLAHIKIIFIEEEEEGKDSEIGLLYMGSHNATKAAWGRNQKSKYSHIDRQYTNILQQLITRNPDSRIPKEQIPIMDSFQIPSIEIFTNRYPIPKKLITQNINLKYLFDNNKKLQYNNMQSQQNSFQKNFLNCQSLQQKLKDEYLLLMTEQDQKANFQKKLTNSLNNFYRNFVHFDLTYTGSQKKSEKRLLEDQGFGNSYIFIKDIVLLLSKTPQLCLKIIQKHNGWSNIQTFDGIIKVLTNSMFENIVDEDLSHKDILYFLDGILEIIVRSKDKHYEYNFQDKTLVSQIIKQFMRKPQYRSYTEQVARGTLLQIAKLDHMIDFRPDGDQDSHSKKTYLTRKVSESPTKRKPSGFKNPNIAQKATSKVQIYCQGLKKKDEKIRTCANLRTKNRNCASSDLLRFLGIIDSISFPTFSCISTESQLKEEERVTEQWSILLTKKQSNKNFSSPDITVLKNLVFSFFGDLFKMLYSMPMVIRILCRMLFNKFMNKYNDRKIALTIIGNFIISFWICQSLKFDDLLFETGKISLSTNQNIIIIKKAISAVIVGDQQLVDKAFHAQFNLIISNLRLSVFNYLSQLINIEIAQYKQQQQIHKINSHTVCLSIADVQLLIKMITNTPEQQINSINDKILKKIKKIKQISQDTNIFGSRLDKSTNKQYQNYQSFVLFSEVVFPKDLSYDYMKYYNDAFKKEKLKNTLRQVLLNIADLNDFYEFPNDCQNLYEFFQHILKSRQERLNLNAIDRIPVELKISYLLSISKYKPIENILVEMFQQAEQRLKTFKQVWDRSKQYYLTAISSVIAQNQKISVNQNTLEIESKKQKLNEFMAKHPINICITSPKTRQKEIVLKTNVIGQINEEQKKKIWLQNQSQCIHTALNLDFIKSLTGEAQKSQKKYQSHISTPHKFADLFCSLPEVKENGMSGEDSVGIMDILEHFTTFCINTIKADSAYESLTSDLRWLQQNLQQKITKKIYDKLYPKYATFQDLAFYLRLKTLDWITYDHLKIQMSMRVSGMWDIAAKILKQVQKMKTASEKLDRILQCNKIIAKSYSLVSDANKAITPDDMYPIVIYILIKAAPRRIISNVNFIEMYANKNKLMSRDGYFLTQLKSAILYCENMSHQDLGMGMVEFNKKIYQKQIQYGIYFMTPRRRNSPRTTQRKIDYLKKHYFLNQYKPIEIPQKHQNGKLQKHRKNSQGKICIYLNDDN